MFIAPFHPHRKNNHRFLCIVKPSMLFKSTKNKKPLIFVETKRKELRQKNDIKAKK